MIGELAQTGVGRGVALGAALWPLRRHTGQRFVVTLCTQIVKSISRTFLPCPGKCTQLCGYKGCTSALQVLVSSFPNVIVIVFSFWHIEEPIDSDCGKKLQSIACFTLCTTYKISVIILLHSLIPPAPSGNLS